MYFLIRPFKTFYSFAYIIGIVHQLFFLVYSINRYITTTIIFVPLTETKRSPAFLIRPQRDKKLI